MVEFFQRGRGMTILCVAVAGLLAITIVIEDGYCRKAIFLLALVIGLFLTAMWISSSKKSEGTGRDALRRIQHLESLIAEMLANEEPQRQGNQKRVLRALNQQYLSPGMIEERSDAANNGLFFAPGAVPSVKIVGRPTSHQPGRIAAEQTMESDGFEILKGLMDADSSARSRGIELIGSATIESGLSPLGNVRRFFAPHQLGEPHPLTAYLVIDEEELQRGLWAGTLNTQATKSFSALASYIRKAKQVGVVVIVVQAAARDHFSNELRELATVVVTNGKPRWGWGEDVNLPVLTKIAELLGADRK
ncbi:hypothetical protein R3O64_09210 [Corynebacterium hesseae]|uniref:hypothetical protein n=1 Tax=Corynebacterium hesseae TaxID=2913502 RepID=UPI0030CF0036